MSNGTIKFEEFELDMRRYELRRGAKALKLEKIPMEILAMLVASDSRLVTRDEIVEKIWGKGVFVDTEHGINTAIRKIRYVLGDDPDHPRFVQTVTGKGYRFVAATIKSDVDSGASPNLRAETPTPPVTPALPAPSTPRQWWPTAAAGVGLCVLAGTLLGLNVGGLRTRLFSSRRPQIHSIAVLPLVNFSGDPAQDYFADGMTEELITMLAKNTSLRVVSRTTAMQYKAVNRPLREIAQELGVDGILEGSLEKSSNRVHMTVQLIYAPTDTHVWAESYDRDLSGTFALPYELSQITAKEIRVAVAAEAPPRYIDAEAHDAYLRGRYFWFVDNYDRGKEYFEKAIRLQPDYSAAWSGLADSYTANAVVGSVLSRDVIPKARDAALKAVELDGCVPEARNALAAVYLFGDWDLKRADEESLRATTLPTGYAEAHHLRSWILAILGRFDESVREEKRAMEMDPFGRPWALGAALIQARRLDEAANELRLRAEAQPSDPNTLFILGSVYVTQRKWKEYAESFEKAFQIMNDKVAVSEIHAAFTRGGGQAVAEWDLNKTKAQARKGYVSPWQLALLSARLQRKEETLRFLENAYSERSAPLIFLQVEPAFDILHRDPRYRNLVKKIGLPPAY